MAMVKPQIAACFAIPFLQRRQISGLVLGAALLLDTQRHTVGSWRMLLRQLLNPRPQNPGHELGWGP